MHASIALISSREQEILHLIAHENTTPEIARELFISEDTVKTHRKNLLIKFQARNIAGLIIKGVKHGLLEIK